MADSAEVTEAEVLEKSKLFHGKTEADVRCDLSLRLGASLLEGGKDTNCIIDVGKPWSVDVWWSLHGSLRECICGIWCVSLHLESIGKAKEFSIPHRDIKLNPCGTHHYHARIEGRGLDPDDCTTPYKLVATISYKNLCGTPGPILGFVELPLVQFYESGK